MRTQLVAERARELLALPGQRLVCLVVEGFS
jgi:hypothetical protein